jgi:zona occludens toxin
MTSATHKLKELGSHRYVVRLFRGFKMTGKPSQTLGPFSFKEKIFTLYKSYSHEKAKEQSIDSR